MKSLSRWAQIAFTSLALFTAVMGLQLACSPTGGGNTADNTTGGNNAPVIRGHLAMSDSSPARQLASEPAGRDITFDVTEGCEVVAVSNATQQVYRATVDANGDFELGLPDSESGNTFVLTVLGPDGKPLGPVLVGAAEGNGVTGLKPAGEVDLGTVEIPANLGDAPITAGADADLPAGSVDDASAARLDANGVPVGVNSFGKGEDAETAAATGEGSDADKDGLVDLFDADDDGDGMIDDLEAGASAWALPPGAGIGVSFFTNLKIEPETSGPFYHGTQAEIDAALSTATSIGLDVWTEPFSTRTIVGARVLSSPAPAYLPLTTIPFSGELWSASNYVFTLTNGVYGAAVVPNAVMQAGDTLTIEVAFSDGDTEQYTRMINYFMKNIPSLVKYGSPGNLQNYDPGYPANFGTNWNPVPFDGAQPLVLEFHPPLDETGAYLEGFRYVFHLFFYDNSGSQINRSDIDSEATWPTPIPGLENMQYHVDESAPQPLMETLSADNTYTVQIPAEVLPAQLTMKDASVKTVTKYKIDITADCPSGNAAICVYFERE